ncbi:MAG: hypothetical protein J7L77_09540 [Clostridiales bacterium]|nr:hypothetical protein [Clostridiales bacterium]
MKKRVKSVFLVLLVVLLVVVPLSGCKKAGDKINEELAEGITEKYLEGVTGGNADIDIEEGKWPQDMPNSVPEFKKGKIDSSSSITVSGTTQLSVLITGVKEKDFTSYTEDLVKAGFTEVMTSNYNGVLSGSYMEGENYLSLTLDTDSDEMMIGFTGNE